MKIVVTGGTGFIGTHLVAALRERGHAVWIVTRGARRQDAFVPEEGWLAGDLVSADLERVIPGEIDVVYHLAGMGSPAQCQADPSRCFTVNVTATQRLLDVVRRRGVRRFVFVSSAYVYGDGANVPTSEEALLQPTDALGASKAAAEFLVRGYGACFGFPVTVFRLYTVYGPGSNAHQLIPSLISQVLREGSAITIRDARPTRDFMDVRDAVGGLLTALSQAGSFELVNLGTGVETSVGELCALLLEIGGREHATCVSRYDGHGENRDTGSRQCADITRAVRTLGWRPQISLREGLARMFAGMEAEWQRKQENLVR